MEYKGKLYGKVGKAYFPLHNSTDDFERLEKEIKELKSVMIAAAEEIQLHWQAHCDKEGYGPANLMHRLEKGIASYYAGYNPGQFTKLEKENEALKLRKRSDDLTLLEKYTNFLLKHGYCDTDVYSEPPTAIDQFMKGTVAMMKEKMSDDLICPFCKDLTTEFDAIGLKHHLLNHCAAYGNVESLRG